MTARDRGHDQDDDAHVSPERAAGLMAIAKNDPERVAAETHARDCAECRALLTRAAQTMVLIDAWDAPPPPDPKVLARIAAEVGALSDFRRGAQAAPPDSPRPVVSQDRRHAGASIADARATPFAASLLAPIVAVAAASVIVLGAAHPDLDAGSIGLAAAACGAAVIAMLVSQRLRGWTSGAVTAAAIVGSLAMALVDRHAWVEVPWPKLGCLGLEVGVALFPATMVAWLAVRARSTLRAIDLAAVAACGALTAQAALVIACPGQPDRAHVIGLHVTGVVLAALLGAAATRLRVLRRAA